MTYSYETIEKEEKPKEVQPIPTKPFEEEKISIPVKIKMGYLIVAGIVGIIIMILVIYLAKRGILRI